MIKLFSFLLLIVCTPFAATVCIAHTNVEEHPTLPIGAKAPDFNLKGVDDKMYNLSSFSDKKILMIVFTCNHCPTAQAYEDRIIKMTNDYAAKGVG